MESNEVQAALASAVEEVVETMCFASVIASSEAASDDDVSKSGVSAELRFEGDPSGGFRLDVESAAARVLGAAFLGREEHEVTDAQQGEVVCELANMICGSVLSRLERATTFHITHPCLVPKGATTAYVGTEVRRCFDLGEGVMTTCFRIQQGT